jgi:uncharacterized Zn-binding protein involved in type VI secretion
MRLALVRHGDRTTTRGFVMAFSSTMHDDGKKIALSGDKATCGSCKGAYPIYGTGEGVSEGGRVAVVHGDKVLCPCGKNRVIAGSDAGCHLERESEASLASWAESGPAVVAPLTSAVFDERVRSLTAGAVLNGYPYFIKTADGRTSYGRTDAGGNLPRIETQDAKDYTVYWGDDALAKQQGS